MKLNANSKKIICQKVNEFPSPLATASPIQQ